MSNPYFIPETSSDTIYFGQEMGKCLTDEVNAKAPSDHNHEGAYAPTTHDHNETYAGISHNHDSSYASTSHGHTDKADLVNGKVPISQIPDEVKEIRFVANIAARDAITGAFAGLSAYVADATGDSTVTSGGAFYMHNGTAWIKTSEAESMDLILQWANITGKPETFPPAEHTHSEYAAAGHNHNSAYAPIFTNANGGPEYFYGEGSGKNVLTEIAAYPQGLHTLYSYGGTEGNPKNTESWRMLVHKTSAVIGWVLAFGTSGSIYSNYYDSGWKGWRCIYDALGAPLWTGEMYMAANHEIIPTKALSNCAHGWLLLWSDYNPGEGVGNTDFHTTVISKFAYTGQKWAGGQWLCHIPRYADESGEATIVKILQVHDTKLVGHAANSVSPRNDVVLRAVYEI